ncbi:uridine-cytidine kinase-like 1 isoform X6 [Physeter macrocephalus]|uniref:Uridine-cytidine kinase n=1 Tax=Physeter macrocephalus TaxID=9755 RepID=A0A9W2X3Y3_PHYMC|nr:uridine-cytidine kinase-like 1 isoform X6 [Physeter catodon]
MLGGAVLSAFRLPARRRGRGPWRLWGLCRRGGGGGRCHLVGGGGFRCQPRARPQGVTAKRRSGEGWLLTSGSEPSLGQGQRWPQAGACSWEVPWPGLLGTVWVLPAEPLGRRGGGVAGVRCRQEEAPWAWRSILCSSRLTPSWGAVTPSLAQGDRVEEGGPESVTPVSSRESDCSLRPDKLLKTLPADTERWQQPSGSAPRTDRVVGMGALHGAGAAVVFLSSESGPQGTGREPGPMGWPWSCLWTSRGNRSPYILPSLPCSSSTCPPPPPLPRSPCTARGGQSWLWSVSGCLCRCLQAEALPARPRLRLRLPYHRGCTMWSGRSTLPWPLVCLSLRKVSPVRTGTSAYLCTGHAGGQGYKPTKKSAQPHSSGVARREQTQMASASPSSRSSSNAEPVGRLLPPVGAGRPPRKRTTSQCKSEPPLLRTSKRTIYTAGRPPWYNEHGTQSKEAFAIGLGGGSASGKTTVARMIIEALDVPWVVLLSMDSFYKVLTRQQQEQAAHNNFNFDHPDAFDFDLIISTLKKLKQGKSVKVPIYDFTTHSRKKDWKTLYGANVIIFEGIMAFADKTLLELLDMKIFVDTDSDIRLVRRLRRDISERGRAIEGVIKQYNKFVKPAFDQYIQPTMRLADIVVPRGSGNAVAIDLIVQHVHSQLEERKLRWDLAALASAHQCHPLPRTLSVLKSTPQVRGMHTIIRDRETSRDEFIFYSKRLMRLLIEHALSFLPFQDCVVQTPQGQDYSGKCYAGKQITGVSILRAGETMEPALRAVCKDVRIGTILIQTNQLTGEPELHYLRLPKDISDDHVILMDCTVSTGAAAMMAVRVLLDHDVPEDKIFLLSLLMAEMGVHSVAYAFPRVRIITTAVDKRVNDLFRIIPGIGNFGDRYFGTDAVPDGSDEEEGGSAG